MDQLQHTDELREVPDTVTLSLDDGKEIVCHILTIFSIEDLKQDYIALVPIEEYEGEEGVIFLYKFFDDPDEPKLELIESDDEYEQVSEAFEEWIDAVENGTVDLDEIDGEMDET